MGQGTTVVNLKELISAPREAAGSLAELNPWFGMSDKNTVICQNGSLLAGFLIFGEPLNGVDDELLNSQIDLLQRSFRVFGDRITVWSVLERHTENKYQSAHFSNEVAALINTEYAKKILNENHGVLTHTFYVGYRFSGKTDAFITAVNNEMHVNNKNIFQALFTILNRAITNEGAVATLKGQLHEMQTEFNRILGAFEGVVNGRMKFKRMSGDEIVGRLSGRLNLASPSTPIRLHSDRLSYFGQKLGTDTLIRKEDQLLFRGVTGDRYVAAMSLTEMPPVNYSFHVDMLMAVPYEFAIVQMFQFLDRPSAQSAIEKAEQFYRMEVKSLGTRIAEGILQKQLDKINTGNLLLADDAQQALAEVTAGDISYGYYSMTILAMGSSPSETTRCLEATGSALRSYGYQMTKEINGLMPAFLSTLPGNGIVSVRKTLASSSNLADLVPFRTLTSGDEYHQFFSKLLNRPIASLIKFLTDDGVPYNFNPHIEDLGHFLVIGGSGAGKTVLLHLLVTLFQKVTPARTYIFDKDHSMMLLTLLLGGKHIDLKQDKQAIKMNPVRRMLSTNADHDLLRWLEVLIAAGDQTIDNQERDQLFAVIQDTRMMPEQFWRLGHIYTAINGENRELAAKLAPYVDRSNGDGDVARKGAFSDFFDNDSDSFELTEIVGMEVGGLLEIPQLAAPFMDYAFWVINQSLDGETPTLIYVEEMKYLLKNSVFVAKLDDWVRTLRKRKAFVGMATQGLSEIESIPSAGGFLSSIPTRIFLPSVSKSVSSNRHLYQSLFELNDAQLAMLNDAVPKRDYLICQPQATRLVRSTMPDILLRINEATSRDPMRKRAKQMAQQGDPRWAMEFIRTELKYV